MKTVRQIIGQQREVWSINVDAFGLDALKKMAEKNVSALAVVEGARPVGIVAGRDFARKILLRGIYARPFRVSDIMTPNPLCAGLDHTSEECMALMIAKHIWHLPVVGSGGARRDAFHSRPNGRRAVRQGLCHRTNARLHYRRLDEPERPPL